MTNSRKGIACETRQGPHAISYQTLPTRFWIPSDCPARSFLVLQTVHHASGIRGQTFCQQQLKCACGMRYAYRARLFLPHTFGAKAGPPFRPLNSGVEEDRGQLRTQSLFLNDPGAHTLSQNRNDGIRTS
jgi:hypothetical protein